MRCMSRLVSSSGDTRRMGLLFNTLEARTSVTRLPKVVTKRPITRLKSASGSVD
jgi:hypothetical protein